MVAALLHQPLQRARAPRALAHGVGQLNLHFEHFQVVLALQLHLEVFRVDLDVLGDDGDQLALQGGQVVGLGGAAAVALVRQDDLQAFFGNAGGFFFSPRRKEEGSHGLFAPEQAFKSRAFLPR